MKKLSEEKKAILIYSGELMIFAVVFAVLATLKLTGVMAYKESRRLVFNYITLAGGTWGIVDFIWALASKKRRAKVCLIDKITVLPLSIFILTYDLICLIAKPSDIFFYTLMLSIAFYYVAIVYAFQAIYHYYKPVPSLLEAIEEDKKAKEEEKAKENENDPK